MRLWRRLAHRQGLVDVRRMRQEDLGHGRHDLPPLTHPASRPGRVRLELADKVGGLDMIEFACEVITPGATIRTDGARMFSRLAERGYVHESTPGYAADDLDAVMPGPHLVSSLLKRWTAGTLHYRLSRQHLPYYLDEFTFRFNRRTSKARGMLFYRLLQQAVDTDPHPLKDLIGG
jgi:hypothetical protein